jgi:hypothetical protein
MTKCQQSFAVSCKNGMKNLLARRLNRSECNQILKITQKEELSD